MTNLITTMKKEQKYLEQIKCKVQEDIRKGNKDKLPGKLRIQRKGNSLQYYHTDAERQSLSEEIQGLPLGNQMALQKSQALLSEKQIEAQAIQTKISRKRQETYIPKKNIVLARNLSQRDYNIKLLQEIE